MSPKLGATDRRREQPRGRFWRRALSFVSVGALVGAPVVALSLWLLITDPVTAAAVMERGDLLPVVVALAKLIGRAVVAVMSAL